MTDCQAKITKKSWKKDGEDIKISIDASIKLNTHTKHLLSGFCIVAN